jgi:Gpi18-like mannosyltransferase
MNLQKNYLYWIGGILLAVSLAVRLAAYHIVTSDYTYFVAKWFTQLQIHPWLSAFQQPFADYAPLYLYMLKILTFIPVNSLYSEKTLSFLFDILVAYGAYLLVKYTAPIKYSSEQLFLVFAVMLSVPTIVVNTSLWGQSDSIYAAGVVFSLYYILRDRPLPAVLAFAFALCVKAQAIFFLPVLLGYYFRKDFRLAWQLLLIPAAFFVSVLPAWLGGGSFTQLLFTYLHQSGEYTDLSVSAQSVFAYVQYSSASGEVRNVLFVLGLLIALLVVVGIVALIARLPKEKYTPTTVVLISVLCVLLLPYVLPRMHERYFYLADVLSVVYAFYNPRHYFLPIAVIFASLISYMPFLSGQVSWFTGLHIDLRIGATILLVSLGFIGVILFRRLRGLAISPA